MRIVALHRVWSVHATFWIVSRTSQLTSSAIGVVSHLAHIRVPGVGPPLRVGELVLGLVRVHRGQIEVVAAVIGHLLHLNLTGALPTSWYQLFFLRLLMHIKLLLLTHLTYGTILISHMIHIW